MVNQTGVFETITNVVNTALTQFAVALVILFIGLILGRLIGKLIKKLMFEFEVDKTLKESVGIRIPLSDIVSATITYFIYFIAVIMALDNLGIATQVLNIVSIGVLVLLILFVFLGIKDFIPNAISGLFLHKKKFVKEGDWIAVDEVEGEVVYLNLVECRIKTKNGDIIYIPNAQLTRHKVRKKSVAKKQK